MKEFNKYKKKPESYHVACETKTCTNYYNATYRDADGYCKPCQKRKKNEQKLRSNRAS